MALLLIQCLDRAQLRLLCNGPWEEKSVPDWAEWHYAVVNVMPNVRATAISDAGSAAPIFHDRGFILSEIRVICRDVTNPAEPQPRRLPHIRTSRDMEHGSVDAIVVFAHVLDQEIDARKIRLKNCSQQRR